MVSEPTDETLTQTAIRLKEYRNKRIDKITKIGMFKQALCKEVTAASPECFNGNEYYVWLRIFLLPQIVKPKPIDKVLMKARVGNVRDGEIKIKVYRRI